MKKIAIILTILFLSITNVLAFEENLSVTTLPSGQKVIIKEVHDNAIVKIDTNPSESSYLEKGGKEAKTSKKYNTEIADFNPQV